MNRSSGKKRSDTATINTKYLGNEPSFDNPVLEQAQLVRALNWYRYCRDSDDAREYLVQYLINGHQQLADQIAAVPERLIPMTAAWLARLAANGYDFDHLIEQGRSKIVADCVSASLAHKVNDESFNPNIEDGPRVSVQSRIRGIADSVFIEIEDALLEQQPFDMYKFITAHELSAPVVTKLMQRVQSLRMEVECALEGNDPQLREAYRFLTKKELRQRLQTLTAIVDDCDRHVSNSKKQRAPRVKKPVAADKQVAKVVYQKESAEFKVKSIAPNKIVGASELWTFNTKTKIVTHLVAVDRGGLKVKGTTVFNFGTSSASYRTGRKTNEVLEVILNQSKRAVAKMTNELQKLDTVNGRLNEATILLLTK